MKRYLVAAVAVGALFAGFASPVLAQENPFEGFPTDIFNKAKEAIPQIEITKNPLGEGVSQMNAEAVERDIANSLGGVWDSLNAWMQEKLGVSLSEIITTVLTFVFWLIKLTVKILRAVLNLIPF